MQISRFTALTVAALSLLASCSSEEPTDEPVVVVAFDDEKPNDVRDDDDNNDDAPLDDDDDPVEDPDDDPVEDPDDVVDPGPEPNDGWIGGACAAATDCSFDNGVCLTDGHPFGECTQSCDGVCPDRDGANSLTFCMDAGDAGRCVSRCDTELFGFRGCREGYECQARSLYDDFGNTTPVCVPRGTPPETPPPPVPCLEQLDNLGVDYRAWGYSTQTADGLACTIDDPIYVSSPINGVSYRYLNESAPGELAVACEMALALHKFGDLAAQYDIVEVEHIGTFNCRKISGTDYLSMHGYGLAIDFYGFTDSAGQDYILERDWEHDTTNPSSAKAQMLYNLATDMFEQQLFNIILTPNYNAGHDNHFHVDLTPGALYIGSYFSPYALGTDCGN